MSEIGKTYGHLTIRETYKQNGDKGQTIALCDCDCGGQTRILLTDIKMGRRTSCGHVRRNPKKPGKGKDKYWQVEERKQMERTAAHQHWLSTYRPNGGDCGQTG